MLKVFLKAILTTFLLLGSVTFPEIAMAGPPPGGYLDELKYPNIIPPELQFGTYGFEVGQLNDPVGIAISSDNFIYITDSSNDRVQVFNFKGDSVKTWGSYGIGRTEFKSPMGISLSPDDDKVYVADSGNNRIQVFDKEGTFQKEWGSFGSAEGEFREPIGIALDANKIYVADSGNNRIQIFDRDGHFISSFGKYGDALGSFNYPRSVTSDEKGNIYVADTYNNRIQKFDPLGNVIKAWGTYGSNSSQLVQPSDVSYQHGELYVADLVNHRVQIFDSEGGFLYQFGRHPPKSHEGNGRLHYPMSLAVSPSGDSVAVCEQFENRCQLFTKAKLNLATNVDDSAWWFKGPTRFHYGSRTISAAGILAISEEETHTALLFDNTKEVPRLIGAVGGYGKKRGQFMNPSGVTFSRDGKLLYVSDNGNHRIQTFRIGAENQSLQQSIAAPTSQVQLDVIDSFGEFEEKKVKLEQPGGLATNPQNGDLYAVDVDNSKVRVFNSQREHIREWGEFGIKEGQFNKALNLTIDPTGSIVYVVDSYNRRVQAFDTQGKFLFSWGQADESKNQFPGYNGFLVYPFDVTTDKDGNVYVTDVAGQKVNKYDSKGRFIKDWGGFGSDEGKFYKPKGITIDEQGRVIVVDFGNHRGQIFSSDGDFISMFGIGTVYTQPDDVIRDAERAKTRRSFDLYRRKQGS